MGLEKFEFRTLDDYNKFGTGRGHDFFVIVKKGAWEDVVAEK